MHAYLCRTAQTGYLSRCCTQAAQFATAQRRLSSLWSLAFFGRGRPWPMEWPLSAEDSVCTGSEEWQVRGVAPEMAWSVASRHCMVHYSTEHQSTDMQTICGRAWGRQSMSTTGCTRCNSYHHEQHVS